MPIKWALPGAERQDSVYNGLQEEEVLHLPCTSLSKPVCNFGGRLACVLCTVLQEASKKHMHIPEMRLTWMMLPMRAHELICGIIPGAGQTCLLPVTGELVAIHDSARPLITPKDALRCFQDGWQGHMSALLKTHQTLIQCVPLSLMMCASNASCHSLQLGPHASVEPCFLFTGQGSCCWSGYASSMLGGCAPCTAVFILKAEAICSGGVCVHLLPLPINHQQRAWPVKCPAQQCDAAVLGVMASA
eukprot:scaffold34917_cov22-Tisochrysis_lutea.AAC.1